MFCAPLSSKSGHSHGASKWRCIPPAPQIPTSNYSVSSNYCITHVMPKFLLTRPSRANPFSLHFREIDCAELCLTSVSWRLQTQQHSTRLFVTMVMRYAFIVSLRIQTSGRDIRSRQRDKSRARNSGSSAHTQLKFLQCIRITMPVAESSSVTILLLGSLVV